MDTRALPLSLALAVAAGGCGGSTSSPDPEPTTGDETERPERSEVQRLNERAREGAVTETLHGTEVADPYRALESDSPLTQEWIEAQTARTRQALSRWRDPDAAERLDELLSIGVIGSPVVAGERVFYTKREGDREQPALYVREGGALRDEPLVDPLTYGERAALDWFYPSPSGRYVAFGISESGDERSTLRILDVREGEVLDDTIEHAKWSSVAWLHGEDGFYYRRYPRAGEPDYDPEAEDTYHLRLFFHELGADPAEDSLVFSPAQGTDFPSASVSRDDRWLVVNVFRGWSESDVYLFDRGRRARSRRIAPDDEHPLVEVVTGEEHLYYASVHRGRLYLTHNEGAPRYRVDAVDPDEAADRDAWETVVPEGEGAIEDVAIVRDRIVVHTIEDIASRLSVYRLNGREAGAIELPGRGEIFGLDGDPETGQLAVGYSSFVHPPALFTWSTRETELTEVDRVQTDLDFEDFELTQASVESEDGTSINVWVVHRRGMTRDGSQRVLLTGYGGFNVSLLPGFQRNALYWVERGGVYAVANLRGGGELGEEWHRAGNLGNKERVFEDFEAVLRWLGGESGISRPERVAITGGSNGGLLMGALITRAPETFAAAVSSVGLYDMIRYHRFPPAELWITEYGSADEPAQFEWLMGYSPYHHVREGVEYPAVLVTTADHDTRVHWAHSTKFAAALQEATGQPDPPVYFYMEREQGHGAGTRRSDTVERYVRLYTFVEHHVGAPEPPRDPPEDDATEDGAAEDDATEDDAAADGATEDDATEDDATE
ncbi:MAG TPA: prolyl oligopeptidase family serine peptidase [Sandaracinaceae bacterium LLY-WYZ-13_1]|nr:prolyl oligopeptidase family serine peptidase [Sandaracinaceae bacterium LLY-WYZ-13_1]